MKGIVWSSKRVGQAERDICKYRCCHPFWSLSSAVVDVCFSLQIGSAIQGLGSLAQEASLLASNLTESVGVAEHTSDLVTAAVMSAAASSSPSASAPSSENARVVARLQQQALSLSSELQESRRQLRALQARSTQKEQSEEIVLAMAKAAERQSDLSLNEVSRSPSCAQICIRINAIVGVKATLAYSSCIAVVPVGIRLSHHLSVRP